MNTANVSFILKGTDISGEKLNWFISHKCFLLRLSEKHGLDEFTLNAEQGQIQDYLKGIEDSEDILEIGVLNKDYHFSRTKIKNEKLETTANVFKRIRY
jgi:hypothetical protein